jgi:hypothetical protein
MEDDPAYAGKRILGNPVVRSAQRDFFAQFKKFVKFVSAFGEMNKMTGIF